MNGVRVIVRLPPHNPSTPQWVITNIVRLFETLQAKRYLRTASVTPLRVAMERIGAVMRLEVGLWSKVVGMGAEQSCEASWWDLASIC